MKPVHSLRQFQTEASHWAAALLCAAPLGALHWLVLLYAEG